MRRAAGVLSHLRYRACRRLLRAAREDLEAMNETIEYQEFLLAEQQARIDSLTYDYEQDLSRLRNALKEIVAYKPLDGYDISEAYWDLRHIAHGALEADDE